MHDHRRLVVAADRQVRGLQVDRPRQPRRVDQFIGSTANSGTSRRMKRPSASNFWLWLTGLKMQKPGCASQPGLRYPWQARPRQALVAGSRLDLHDTVIKPRG